MIQLLVPHHREPVAVVRRLLDSVASQMYDMSEVSVVICEDGGDVPEYGTYPFELVQTRRPHGGVSATRNALLDMAYGDYVMLCDADDQFTSAFGLSLVSAAMPFDVMVPPFYQENPDGSLFIRTRDRYLVHGKAFRLRYLRENGIRWLDDLTVSGDNYFLWQALLLADEVKFTDAPYYAWRYNGGSVCRSEPDHFQRAYPLTLRGMGENVRDFLRRGRGDLARDMAVLMAMDAYFMTSSSDWDQTTGYAAESAEELSSYAGDVLPLLEDATDEELASAHADRRKCYMRQGPPPDGLMPWVRDVVSCGRFPQKANNSS